MKSWLILLVLVAGCAAPSDGTQETAPAEATDDATPHVDMDGGRWEAATARQWDELATKPIEEVDFLPWEYGFIQLEHRNDSRSELIIWIDENGLHCSISVKDEWIKDQRDAGFPVQATLLYCGIRDSTHNTTDPHYAVVTGNETTFTSQIAPGTPLTNDTWLVFAEARVWRYNETHFSYGGVVGMAAVFADEFMPAHLSLPIRQPELWQNHVVPRCTSSMISESQQFTFTIKAGKGLTEADLDVSPSTISGINWTYGEGTVEFEDGVASVTAYGPEFRFSLDILLDPGLDFELQSGSTCGPEWRYAKQEWSGSVVTTSQEQTLWGETSNLSVEIFEALY